MEKSDLYTDNFETFEEWISLCINEEEVYPRLYIPYNAWKEEYIVHISEKSEKEVKQLIRLLLQPTTLGVDEMSLNEHIDDLKRKVASASISEINELKKGNIWEEQHHRMLRGHSAWEGLTWVIRLLDYAPLKAMNVLKTYLDAEMQFMPEDRIIGIHDCLDLIEAKFIRGDSYSNTIFSLDSRGFEHLISYLYRKLGYHVITTPATRDGGKDIIATIEDGERKEKVYVECKLYRTSKLTTDIVRAFGFVVNKEEATRGVIYTTGYISPNLKKIDSRIQIFGLDELLILLNGNLGKDWNKRRIPKVTIEYE